MVRLRINHLELERILMLAWAKRITRIARGLLLDLFRRE